MDDLFHIPTGVGIGGVFEPLEESFVERGGGFGVKTRTAQGHHSEIKQAGGRECRGRGVQKIDQTFRKLGFPRGQGKAQKKAKGSMDAGCLGTFKEMLKGYLGLFEGWGERGRKERKGLGRSGRRERDTVEEVEPYEQIVRGKQRKSRGMERDVSANRSVAVAGIIEIAQKGRKGDQVEVMAFCKAQDFVLFFEGQGVIEGFKARALGAVVTLLAADFDEYPMCMNECR